MCGSTSTGSHADHSRLTTSFGTDMTDKRRPSGHALPQITPNRYGSGFYLNANDRSSSTRVRIYTENINGGPLDGVRGFLLGTVIDHGQARA